MQQLCIGNMTRLEISGVIQFPIPLPVDFVPFHANACRQPAMNRLGHRAIDQAQMLLVRPMRPGPVVEDLGTGRRLGNR